MVFLCLRGFQSLIVSAVRQLSTDGLHWNWRCHDTGHLVATAIRAVLHSLYIGNGPVFVLANLLAGEKRGLILSQQLLS